MALIIIDIYEHYQPELPTHINFLFRFIKVFFVVYSTRNFFLKLSKSLEELFSLFYCYSIISHHFAPLKRIIPTSLTQFIVLRVIFFLLFIEFITSFLYYSLILFSNAQPNVIPLFFIKSTLYELLSLFLYLFTLTFFLLL